MIDGDAATAWDSVQALVTALLRSLRWCGSCRPRPLPDPGAGGRQEPPKTFWESTEIGGSGRCLLRLLLDKPTGDAQYRNFDTKHNQFNLSMAEFWVAQDADGGFARRLQVRGERRIRRPQSDQRVRARRRPTS